MFPEERRNKIIEIMVKNERVIVKDLGKKFDVSPETIRRDLLYLQDKNIVKKTYGMASLSEGIKDIYVPPIYERKTKEKREKMAIAEEAIKLIGNNKFLMFDGGSTTECIAEKIKYLNNYEKISIITNGLNLVNICSNYNCENIFMIGGKLLSRTLTFVGPEAVQEIKKYNIDIAFMGTTGVSLEHGFSSSNLFEIEVKKAIVDRARTVVVVADHTKFGKYGLKFFCNFEEIDFLITSDLVEKSTLKSIEANYKEKLKIVQLELL